MGGYCVDHERAQSRDFIRGRPFTRPNSSADGPFLLTGARAPVYGSGPASLTPKH
jgi:hypothetical protein